MSIKDLMEDVRNGKFENKFKECNSINKKIKLFHAYGISISIDQYKNIESKVASIKEGEKESYNYLKNKVEGNKITKNIPETILQQVSGGEGKYADKYEIETVIDILKRMPDENDNNNLEETSYRKFWEIKPFHDRDRGLF